MQLLWLRQHGSGERRVSGNCKTRSEVILADLGLANKLDLVCKEKAEIKNNFSLMIEAKKLEGSF